MTNWKLIHRPFIVGLTLAIESLVGMSSALCDSRTPEPTIPLSPKVTASGAVSGGVLLYPRRKDEPLGALTVDFAFGRKGDPSYEKIKLTFMETYATFGLRKPTVYATSALPYLEIRLKGAGLDLSERIRVMLGSLNIQRETELLDLESKVGFDLARFMFRLKKVERKNLVVSCEVDLDTAGFRYVAYHTPSEAFKGLHLAGVSPRCNLAVGNQIIKLRLELSAQENLSIGQSGDHGNPEGPGQFGSALLSETSADFSATVLFGLPANLARINSAFINNQMHYKVNYESGNGFLDERLTDTVNVGVNFR